MAAVDEEARKNRWYFSKEFLRDSPSRKCGIDEDKELSYRQQAAKFIQDMGQKLKVFMKYVQELLINENVLLMTLGFDVAVEHPHTNIVSLSGMIQAASKTLAHSSYLMATQSLHMSTLCLQYRPTLIACVCVAISAKWAGWEIPLSHEGKEWFYYIDKDVTLADIEAVSLEFLAILKKYPSKLQKKVHTQMVAEDNADGVGSRRSSHPPSTPGSSTSTPYAVTSTSSSGTHHHHGSSGSSAGWPDRKHHSSSSSSGQPAFPPKPGHPRPPGSSSSKPHHVSPSPSQKPSLPPGTEPGKPSSSSSRGAHPHAPHHKPHHPSHRVSSQHKDPSSRPPKAPSSSSGGSRPPPHPSGTPHKPPSSSHKPPSSSHKPPSHPPSAHSKPLPPSSASYPPTKQPPNLNGAASQAGAFLPPKLPDMPLFNIPRDMAAPASSSTSTTQPLPGQRHPSSSHHRSVPPAVPKPPPSSRSKRPPTSQHPENPSLFFPEGATPKPSSQVQGQPSSTQSSTSEPPETLPTPHKRKRAPSVSEKQQLEKMVPHVVVTKLDTLPPSSPEKRIYLAALAGKSDSPSDRSLSPSIVIGKRSAPPPFHQAPPSQQVPPFVPASSTKPPAPSRSLFSPPEPLHKPPTPFPPPPAASNPPPSKKIKTDPSSTSSRTSTTILDRINSGESSSDLSDLFGIPSTVVKQERVSPQAKQEKVPQMVARKSEPPPAPVSQPPAFVKSEPMSMPMFEDVVSEPPHRQPPKVPASSAPPVKIEPPSLPPAASEEVSPFFAPRQSGLEAASASELLNLSDDDDASEDSGGGNEPPLGGGATAGGGGDEGTTGKKEKKAKKKKKEKHKEKHKKKNKEKSEETERDKEKAKKHKKKKKKDHKRRHEDEETAERDLEEGEIAASSSSHSPVVPPPPIPKVKLKLGGEVKVVGSDRKKV
ncbi:unnamed protein product [Cyprideis torosa]|uniref:Uncharacterized protein n=1 Tax=Cyprideis torosa TaxID=163714 RepID=A0A7R8ZH96_9CRUS|nr:unnamed protein product [Cyprideis torosa]CAG0882045.1 unnamed protein product [Cyprideis torosa]